MKVIILGGCGGMGRYASKAISSFDQIQSLTIADLNKENACFRGNCSKYCSKLILF